jgi:hypothetical protein
MTGHESFEAELRAVAPRPEPAFRARLDAQVDAGFPRPQRRLRLPSLRIVLPAAGTAVAAVVAVALVLGNGQDGPAGGPDVAVQRETATPGPAADSGAAAAPTQSVAPAPAGRRVERSARLELGARAGRFQAVTDGVVRTTQRFGGFVATSQIGRDGGGGTATFLLRIPAARLDDAMAELSRLGTIRSIEGSTQDLTGTYDAASSQLEDARTQRRAIVARLATASGAEADRLRTRLATATAKVERLERRQRELRARTTYATVDLTVVGARTGAVAPPSDGPWTPGDAWRDARRALEIAAGILIVVASFAVPLGLLAWLAVLLRRRRRDAVLD